MKKTATEVLAFVFLLCSVMLGDKLYKIDGKIYGGTYKGIKNGEIVWQWQSGKIGTIPPSQVIKIENNDREIILSRSELEAAEFIIQGNELRKTDLERRQTIALEKIAKSQTFFMWYIVAIEILGLIYIVMVLT